MLFAALDALPDASGHALTVGVLIYVIKALAEELRQWRNPRERSTAAENRITHNDLQLIDYQLKELKTDRAYNVKWRHWMANQVQKLLAKSGLDCDPMPE